jgi:putative transposase
VFNARREACQESIGRMRKHRDSDEFKVTAVRMANAAGVQTQVVVGDVTYLKAGGRACFLAVVMDVYSRKVVGWALGADRTVNLTARAMRLALRTRALASGLIFHSDRGIEYGAYRYRDVLIAHSIRPSMNRPRCCQDNAHMESFFHSL